MEAFNTFVRSCFRAPESGPQQPAPLPPPTRRYAWTNPLLLLTLILVAGLSQAQDNPRERLAELEITGRGKLPFGVGLSWSEARLKRHLERRHTRPGQRAEIYLEGANYITYTLTFDSLGYEFADVTYSFEKGAIRRASMEAYFGGESGMREPILRMLREAFDANYGAPYRESGSTHWSDKGLRLDIELEDASDVHGQQVHIHYTRVPRTP